MGTYTLYELRKRGCLFSFSYEFDLYGINSVFNENGIHISPKIESVLMNICKSSIHG